MFCAKCGAELLDEARFCGRCGAAVAKPEAAGTDAELERLAAQGDREAFAELYSRHSGRVYDFLLRMVGDPDEASDLMQETFLRAMRALSPEEKGAAFSTWVLTIARNLALKRLERRRRTVTLVPREGDEEAPIFDQVDPDRLTDPQAAAEAQELAGLVWEAASGLDAKQYSLLDLHVRQGLESAEIAEVLGVSKGNAYTMVSRLRDTFESAVASLFMLRVGRRDCPELNRLLQEQSVTALSPAVRRLIEGHVAECEACQERRRKLVSPANILGSFAAVPLPLLLRQRVAEALVASWAQAGTQAAATGLKGLLSQPAAKLSSLSTAWKAVIISGALVVATGGGVSTYVAVTGGLPGSGGGPPLVAPAAVVTPEPASTRGAAATEVATPMRAATASPTLPAAPTGTPATAPGPIIFTRGGPEPDTSQLWAINPDGSGLTLLAELALFGGGYVRHGSTDPQISFRRDKVAFIGVDGNLWLVDAQGGDSERLSTEALAADETFCQRYVLIAGWAPDDRRILYYVWSEDQEGCGRRPDGVLGFHVVDVETGVNTYLPELPNFVAWLDSQRVIFEEEVPPPPPQRWPNQQWYTFDVSTRETQELTKPPFFQCSYAEVSLSYADNTMVYACNNPDEENKIVRANVDNTGQRILLEGQSAELQWPHVSPSGTAFIFEKRRGGTYPLDLDLYHYDLASGRETLVMSGFIEFHEWLDDRRIVVLESAGVGEMGLPGTLYVVDVSTGAKTRLAENVGFR